MRHLSLYRKWRPRTFDAVAGQEPVVRTLRRAIETDRVAHAYLFSGPRGTGKTSTAKVLAMGLNCENGPTPDPDGTCESCRAIVNNSSMDVLEMDAASNRGIDEIRELRDKVNLAPMQGRMKVYIIDEVHMLTTEAFNALLKMLEEPPEHVVFVLATTEKHKVLPTIISRCQSFDFRRPGVSLLAEKLREIADAEVIEAEPAALTLISREARGSFRDAEGLLDQLASFVDGPVTAARVRELLGSAGPEALLETTDALYERRTADALRVVDRLQNEGKDLSRFIGELIAHLRRLMLLPHAPDIALAEIGAEERADLEEQASRIPLAETVRIIEALGDALSRAKHGNPKLELELTFLKLTRDYTEPSVDVLLGRVEALEKAISGGDSALSAAAPLAEDSRDASATPGRASQPEPRAELRVEPALQAGEDQEDGGPEEAGPGYHSEQPEDGRDGAFGVEVVAAEWDGILQDLKGRKQASAEAVFRVARPVSLADNTLEIEFPVEQSSYLELAKQPKHVGELQKVLKERFSICPRLQFRVAGVNHAVNSDFLRAEQERLERPERLEEDAPHPEKRMEAQRRPFPEPRSEKHEVRRQRPNQGSDRSVRPEEDTLIQDSAEVLAMAREFFHPDGASTVDN